ncbi:UvrD-helicase domain-containing protein [Roseiconus lacunae]|uniref:UvrD-helicase domain-containing protein n=1 Tax=Roseiconus lacunae TaxID=2605694 RepID=UPI001E3C0B7D|nr:UvrD-helicase domain-containing protein [Roseiconus lacunae]MCD0460127.1 UvrD-helicase domain-containing protein [Roseiconus lacunae]
MNQSTMTNEASAQDAFHDGHLPPMLVRASAGTGKTYRLTARMLQIFFQGAAPQTVLATTFTRKAAGEILDRILITLADAADPENDAALESLRQQVGLETLPRATCLQLLKKLVANIHRLRICTLDSLFTQLAKSFPFELNLPPAWRLTDEIEEVWLRERAIDSVISTLKPTELSTLLSMLSKGETKRSIVRELDSVVTGAYQLSRRCADDAWQLLDRVTEPDNAVLTQAVATLRFAEPPQKSIRKKLGELADALEQRELDSIVSDRLIQNYAKAKALGEPVKFGRSVLPDGLDDALGALYAAARSHTLTLLSLQNEATGEILGIYDGIISQLKQSARTLGFDDITIRLAAFFSSVDYKSLSRRMDGAIDHLLLDEFQDTSPAQWQVLRPLARRSADTTIDQSASAEDAVPRSFFCVGDTKQAIYGWRGGVAEIFGAVDQEIPGVRAIEQNTSYRSSPVIMEVVNRVFKNLTRHPIADPTEDPMGTDKATYEASAVRNFATSFPTHVAFKDSLPGYVRFETSPKVAAPKAALKTAACFDLAVKQIIALNEAAPDISIGVLTRTNRAVANLIFLLQSHGVDVSQEGGNPLVDSAAVELVLSALMMCEHPGDGRWRYHVESSVVSDLHSVTADQVRSWVSDFGLARTVRRLSAMIAPHCDARDQQRLKQLTQLTINYENNAPPRIRDYVRMVREKRVERPQAASVRVMTVHQSKGLEFDAVVLPELDGSLSGQSPLYLVDAPTVGDPPRAMTRFLNKDSWHFLEPRWRKAFGHHSQAKVTETLCLMYVAITRARQALYMFAHPAKPETKTLASLIHAGLATEHSFADPDLVHYELGREDWYQAN